MKLCKSRSLTVVGSSNDSITIEFEIFSHIGLYYLKIDNRKIAKADEQEKLDIYIDGYEQGHERGRDYGSKKWFNKLMALKQKMREKGIDLK
jgi:hypothetical protein